MDGLSFEDLKHLANQTLGKLEKSWRKDVESKNLSRNTSLQAALNKCPAPWINGICMCLGLPITGNRKEKVCRIVTYLSKTIYLRRVIKSLPPSSLEALTYTIQAGGYVKYSQLSRHFGSDAVDGWWWNEKPPNSVLGQLRVRGLLFVGRSSVSLDNGKVAVVPKELRQSLVELLLPYPRSIAESPPQSPDSYLEVTLRDVATYYEQIIDWQPTLPREYVEDFIRYLVTDRNSSLLPQRVWDNLVLFHFFLDHYSDEVSTLDDLRGYHLSEWINHFLGRYILRNVSMDEKRQLLRTVECLYGFLASRHLVKAESYQSVRDSISRMVKQKSKLGVIHRPPPLGGEVVATTVQPGERQFKVTFNHYWLAILCRMDYDGEWQSVREAAAQMRDGDSKLSLISELLDAGADSLLLQLQEVNKADIMQARRWFCSEQVLRLSVW